CISRALRSAWFFSSSSAVLQLSHCLSFSNSSSFRVSSSSTCSSSMPLLCAGDLPPGLAAFSPHSRQWLHPAAWKGRSSACLTLHFPASAESTAPPVVSSSSVLACCNWLSKAWRAACRLLI
ncbi:hypothetical protein PDJAM_G00242830, partial [Pangasius djambal]|nr:hypothetical protein [Pangasius djambal]